jgi:hypothetical protein
VTIVKKAGDSGSWPLATSQATVKGQLSALIDAVRQLIGNANIASGSSESTDPLTAPFHLYVDFDRGSDIYVTGDYNSFEATGTDEEIIAQKLKRVRNQKMVAGYSKIRPFKTLNRAKLEAAIITSLAWYTFTDERAHRDCVIIHMGSGPQPIYNHPGTHSSAVAITAWGDGKIPTWQELIAFNNDTIGSVLLPRGAAFHGEDLRKCVLVPMWAPPAADIATDYSNIRTILSLTPDVHAVDFTFRDPIGQSQSLHLLYGLGYASQDELNQFYGKVRTALGTSANLSSALAVARLSEYQVVGPISGTPARAWDTVKGASPYPERISLRSEWGMGALFIDGRKLQGLRSTVTAQYTGVEQQTDLNSIQIYSGGSWITPANYQAYLDAQPNDTRTKPERMHCQVLAVGPAFVSTVSMFGVGPAVQVYADLGAEVTSSNGNFTFGDCAAIARGYKDTAFPQDKNWGVDRISAPLNPSALPSALSRTTLGTVSAVSSTTITLAIPLAAGASNNIPAALEAAGYSLAGGNYIWVENPVGDDWRALLTGSAWSTSSPGVINITAALAEGNTDAAPVPVANGSSLAIGKKVYVRRVVDSRTTAQRRSSLRLINTAPTRVPPRGTVLQTTPAGTGISRVLTPETTANTGGEVLIVNRQGGTIGTVTSTAEITVRRGAASVNYAASTYYRKGQVVKALNKHWQAKADFISAGSTPDPALWGEIYRHMPEQYNPSDKAENECPQIKFDVDTDPLDNSATCGINWATIFTSNGPVRDQFRSGVDALGVYAFLRALGFSDAAAWAALTPRTSEVLRLLNPASSTDFPTAPSGGAASGRANWSVEFRRATTVSLLGFTYDVGAGMGVTYSKALPQAQKTISPENLFSTYFTSQGGGRAIVRGTNEEGQEVTVRGLTDAETGELTLAGDLGGNDIDPPQQLENGSIVGTVDFSGVTDLMGGNAVGARASTNRYGFGTIANAAALRSTSTITGANDDALDASLDTRPELVTLPGLNYWARQAGVVTRRTGVAVLYVVPDNAVNASTYNFNGVNAALAREPNRTGADLFDNPPTTRANAVLFLRAAEYANAIFGPEETVEYRLADGPYWNNVSFDHVANVVGALDEFPEGNIVADWTAASTRPTTNVKALHDASAPFRCPCFASGIVIAPLGTTGVWIALALPTKLTFNQTGSMRGIGWLSTAKTLSDTTNYPNSLYGALASYRSSGISFASFVDACLNGLVSAGQELRAFGTKPAIETRNGVVSILDTFFGSQSPGRASKGFLDPYSLILISGAGGVTVSGMYLIGNVTLALSDLPLSVAKGITFTSTGTPRALGTQHSQNLIGGYDSFVNEGFTAAITFAARYRTDASPNNEWTANYDTNCIHVLDDNGYYGLMANRASSGSSRGATLDAIIGDFNAGTTLKMNGFSRSSELFSKTNQFAGVAGVFGNVSGEVKGPWGLSPVASDAVLLRPGSIDNAVWRSAITGALVTSDVTLSSSPGGAQESYTLSSSNPHNIRAQAFFRGVNVNINVTVGGALFSNRFFA